MPGAANLALLLVLAAAVLPATAAEPDVPVLATPDFEPCELRGSGGQGRVAAECATVPVPENPQEPDGRQVPLFVARIPALAPEPAADAVTLINGGPGGSSVSLYVDLEGAFAELRRERDIIVVDQRGTGRSAPLECPSLEEATYEFDADVVRRTTRACVESLDRDLRYYTTSVAVTDLEALRRALGYERWNLYGVSYGTRVTQHYVQRFPDAVRTMVIDGVLPLGLALGPDIALNAERTLDAILERCGAEAYCAETFPRVRDQLEALSRRLQNEPVALEVPHPVTGRVTPLRLHYVQLAMSLRLMSYAPETAALIPLVIQEAAERRNYLPLAAQALLIEKSLLASISFGMHNSVVCTEDVPFYQGLDELWPKLEQTYLGGNQVRALQVICELWPRGVLHPALRPPALSERSPLWRSPDRESPGLRDQEIAPTVQDTPDQEAAPTVQDTPDQEAAPTLPVLLLSGELDPITPPAYAEQAAKRYPNSLHLVAQGQGHGVVARGCVPLLVSDFVTSANVEGLDASCMERLRSDAFFVDLLGPPP